MNMSVVPYWLEGIVDLIVPNLCPICSSKLDQVPLCFSCYSKLPFINEDIFSENHPASTRLKYRIEYDYGFSLFYMQKKSIVSQCISLIKYDYRIKLLNYFSKTFAEYFRKDISKMKVDFIIPVPIHPSKKIKRGYNQCEKIVEILSDEWEIPYLHSVLRKKIKTTSQTSKSRINRWKDLDETFSLGNDAQLLTNKHVLIIDDVLTTGSTLEHCIQLLKSIHGCTVSYATIALAVEN